MDSSFQDEIVMDSWLWSGYCLPMTTNTDKAMGVTVDPHFPCDKCEPCCNCGNECHGGTCDVCQAESDADEWAACAEADRVSVSLARAEVSR